MLLVHFTKRHTRELGGSRREETVLVLVNREHDPCGAIIAGPEKGTLYCAKRCARNVPAVCYGDTVPALEFSAMVVVENSGQDSGVAIPSACRFIL